MPMKGLKKLKNLSKKVYKKHKKIIFDIVLFGSAVKGKAKPEDIDIAVIFKQKINFSIIKKILGSFKGMHAEYLFLSDIYKEPLWNALLQEGYSLLNGKFLYEMKGLNPFALFNYNLKNLTSVEKTKFSHSLFGRKKDGILYKLKGKVLGRGSILVPIKNSEKIREVFERWKVDYNMKKIFVF